MLVAAFPGRYVQGPDALTRLADELGRYGEKKLAIVDNAVRDRVARAVGDGLELIGVDAACTWVTIETARALIRERGAQAVAGIGGGKVIDTARAAAFYERTAFASVPTIVASDAPTSSLAVVYGEDGVVDRDLFVSRNPDLVLVDTALVVEAPVRFLIAGIGDALSTYFEARSARQSGAANMVGGQSTGLAFSIATRCYQVIRQHGPMAVQHCAEGILSSSIEEVVEANVLLSGLGFESSGVAAAHAIHHGLTTITGTHRFLHGEKVAIGVLASLFLSRTDVAEVDEVFSFCAAVGLPVRPSDIGVDLSDTAVLRGCAERACRPGEIIHNEPFAVTPDMVIRALHLVEITGARYATGRTAFPHAGA